MKEYQTILKEITHRFSEAAIGWGLGGSGMMYLHGIDIYPHDIDLFVLPQDFDTALHVLSKSGSFNESGPTGIFASNRYAHGAFMGLSVDLIAGFRIISSDRNVTYYFDPSLIVKIALDDTPIPCCLVKDWIILYEAMGKQSKADLIRNAVSDKSV